MRKDNVDNLDVNLEEVREQGRGKLKLGGEYVTAKNAEPISPDNWEDSDKIWEAGEKKLCLKIEEGDTLKGIAEQYLGNEERWRELEKEGGSSFSPRKVGNLSAGTKVYIPLGAEGQLYKDQAGYKYLKTKRGDLVIRYENSQGKKETIKITDFQEGDYGLWIEEDAPYYFDNGQVVDNFMGEKAAKGEVLNEEKNKFLKEEERIKDGFLWIYPGEEIVFPVPEEEEKEAETETSTAGSAGSGTTEKAQGESTEQESKSGSSGGGSGGSAGSGIPSGQLYVCSGAKLKCSFGSQKSKLKVVAAHNICIQDNMIASMQDYKPFVNIKPFGKCKCMGNPAVASATAANGGKLQPVPCQPNIVAPWMNAKMDLLVDDNPALVESSKLNCVYGGVIEVVDPGQDLVET